VAYLRRTALDPGVDVVSHALELLSASTFGQVYSGRDEDLVVPQSHGQELLHPVDAPPRQRVTRTAGEPSALHATGAGGYRPR
jgi:hypothetical protein